MGCGSSKAEESKLVALCRERTELIRAARDRRYALAAAHAAYFRALAAVGDAFHHFVHEELAPASPPGSPDLVLPSSEGKRKARTGRGSAITSAAASSTSSSVTSLTHSLSPEGSHLPLSSGSESEASPQDAGGSTSFADRKASSVGSGGEGEISSSSHHRFSPTSPNSTFIRSSTAIPTMVYQDPFASPWPNSAYDGYGHPFYGVPIGSPPQEREDRAGPSAPAVAPGTPPQPPPNEASSWDFFDPFNYYEEVLPYYSGGKYGTRSSISSTDLSEVRKQEGIPDLEEEADDDLRQDSLSRSSNSGPSREIGGKHEKVGIELEEKESRSSSAGSKTISGGEDAGSSGKKKGVTFEDVSYVTEESVRSSEKPLSAYSDDQPLPVEGARDVMEVVQEIEEHFSSAAGCGEDISQMLELGKLPYRSRSKMHREICKLELRKRSHRVTWVGIWDRMALPWLIHSRLSPSRHSSKSTIRRKAGNAVAQNSTVARSGSLSSTLEKLYVWEKKLYRSQENSKIDLTWASVRKLGTKISIIIKSANAISSRMHKIRDEELQPLLIELIQGYIRMWKSVLDCHHKQLRAVSNCKSHSLMMKSTSPKGPAAKATKKLELELLNWCNCFDEWIRIQRAYVEALNGWLMKWLPQEQEQTPDGLAPFSPTRLGAPSAFIISNDWHHAIRSISEEKVLERMRAFAEIIRMIRKSREEERRQRLEEERLLQVYDRRLKSRRANQTNGHLEILSGHEGRPKNGDDSLMALYTLRQRLDEKRSTHKATLKRLQDAASSILPSGLLPIVQELETFTAEALHVYSEIRTSNRGGA
ncbi:DUF630 DUF632 domains containing protein [Musa troglodytarum]|uniref:DUF630 DUF632 domains containing protein n=1 Tax=Musa troglodytarum TaxID=320322 RepID=A0A9E7FF15_9LILI|nr:DUF630 DUF632 domains containing protein [Musa troglodytarum]